MCPVGGVFFFFILIKMGWVTFEHGCNYHIKEEKKERKKERRGGRPCLFSHLCGVCVSVGMLWSPPSLTPSCVCVCVSMGGEAL